MVKETEDKKVEDKLETSKKEIQTPKPETPKPKPEEPKPEPKPDPVKITSPEDEYNPDYEEDPGTDQSFSEKKDHIKKYFIYLKLKNLQYKLEDFNVISEFDNKKKLQDFMLMLKNILLYFDSFKYSEALNISELLLKEFKKIK